MAALTADVQIPALGATAVKLALPAVGADTFYAGALVYADATNGKCQVTMAAGDRFLGICAKQKVVAAADELVDVYVDGIFLLPFNGAAVDDVGEKVWMDTDVATDNPADLLPDADITLAANDVLIGKCLGLSGSSGWVKLHTIAGLAALDPTSLDEVIY